MITILRRFQWLYLCILTLTFSSQAQENVAPTFYLGGIQVGEYDQTMWTNGLKAAGMNTVEVTVYARQGDWDSDNLWFDENDEGAMNQIRAAKNAELNVVLILRVALDHAFERNKFLWHGMILPGSNQEIKSWFQKYTAFVLTWSEIAEQEGVEVLVIGSEMNALAATLPITEIPNHYKFMHSDSLQRSRENRALKYEQEIGKELWVQGYDEYDSLSNLIDDRIAANVKWADQILYNGSEKALDQMNQRRRKIGQQWQRLIRKARKMFTGQITYAANFDNYCDVGFWDQLDFMGINAYFPLRHIKNAEINQNTAKNIIEKEHLEEALREGWNAVYNEIEAFQKQQQLEEKPLLFTELGYTYYKGASLEPWSGFGYSVVISEDETYDELIVWNQQKYQPEERAIAITCLYDVVQERSILLQGVLYWKLTTMSEQLSIEPFAMLLPKFGGDTSIGIQALSAFIGLYLKW